MLLLVLNKRCDALFKVERINIRFYNIQYLQLPCAGKAALL
ncbi:hypothetical protein CRENPOLYSF1_890004 [Crenothrix polyspora]|uniref:Uncharacterized protein n=1 Tax=Crenothrix polyspora TaxID=360316 RepID=A0A1R4HJE1_9GAMM|nr:hypothetical protein CRENPOLYSF1_890004 [Crenothrix polyspora]